MRIKINSMFDKTKINMKTSGAITGIFWVFWIIGVHVYVEHIISRPVNGYIQLGVSIMALILTVGLLIKTVKLINNLNKTNKEK